MDELYIDNLDEYIQDEGLLVTYKWLSLTLNVPSNMAKQMLFHYVNKQRKADKSVNLNVTYLISGVIYDEDLKQEVHKVCVVGESKLNDIKETFKRIFSIHFYSVQKAQLHDLNVLYVADYDKVIDNIYETSKYSGIICPSIQLRSSDEINSLQSKLSYKSSSPTKSVAVKGKSTIETKQKFIDLENKENKIDADRQQKLPETELQNNLQHKKNVPKSSKGGIASMFAVQVKKNEDKKVLDSVNCTKTKVCLEDGKKPMKGTLSGFLTKGNSMVKPKNQDQCIKEELHLNKKLDVNLKIKDEEIDLVLPDKEELPLSNAPIKVEAMDCKKSKGITRAFDCKSKIEENVIQNKPKISAANGKGCRTKRKPKKEVPVSNTKRRRIMAMDSSSESSCEETEEMDEDPLPAPLSATIDSDDEDVIPLTPQNNLIDVVEMSKMKKRKLVTKTYMDEQGFFVTKKNYELTSDCSDDENPLPSSNKVIKSPAKQILTNQKRPSSPIKKQTSSPKKKQTLSPKKKQTSSPKKKQTSSPKKKRKSPVNKNKKSPVKRVQSSITSFFKRT